MSPTRTVALTGSDQVGSAAPVYYMGFAIRETAGAVATVRVYDNASAASGTLVDEVGLVANESAREFYPGGIWCINGLYVKVVAGTVEGSLRIG